ncbi:MAG: molybdenum ABC transporter ATP-binding protein [Cruoricaptor ignavus]|nr:molybdenum ABC transporter ATP-binding protein [Cruoricaptor ignavus]
MEIAIKFVNWEVPPLELLKSSVVYKLRLKVINGEKLTREEKNWIAENVNTNSYFNNAVPLRGYRFDFSQILNTYVVQQYNRWQEYNAPDKTSLRAMLYGKIQKIIKVKYN